VTRRAHLVLWALQAIILVLPLFLGGRQAIGLVAAWLVVTGLLALTLIERRRAGQPTTPGARALAAFVALGLATALPLPPPLIERLAPTTAQLYRDVLPGWPGGGGWATWRSLALDPFAVWTQLSTLAVGFGAYLVLVGYPWGDEAARARAFGRVFLTVLSGGVAVALLALLAEVAGNGHAMWVSDEPVAPGRMAAPFVNPNHLACWLEMVIPAALAYAWVLARRLGRQIVKSIESGRRLGLRPRRAWVGSLIASQRRLSLPFLAAAAVTLLVTVHLGTQSRGGTAGLLVGLGVTAGGILASLARRRHGRVPRWIPAAAAVALLFAALAPLGLWMRADGSEAASADEVDVSLSSRLAVALEGTGIVRDHPLLGTGLGSWLHAFRGYVGPPVEGGIWDHAHDEYLELAAETGILGVALAALFALGVVGAVRSARRQMLLADGRRERCSRSLGETPDWQAALGDHRTLAWGLAGGIAAVLLHSTMEFGLHMPGNFVLLMVLVGLVVVALPVREGGSSLGLGVFVGLGLVAAIPLALNTFLLVSGGTPLSPDSALSAADRAFSENHDAPRAQALVLEAIDRSPAYRDAHEMLAQVLGPGPDGEEALRRALRLEPWYVPGRDDLAFRLWHRGEHEAAAAELEESLYRFPYLVSHSFLGPDAKLTPGDGPDVVRALANGDIVKAHLASLDPTLTDAIARGLDRALAESRAGEKHTSIVADRVTLLEARERWVEAADMLRAEARLDDTDDRSLGHAARNYLKVNDLERAEEALLAALLRNPERGSLYQHLAVDVYTVQCNFPLAEKAVEAGERNAVDMLPVYNASADVIAKREDAWAERVASPEPGPELPLGPELSR
jgi:O-antigen ligase/tetratricopeptide (TPR) repeat protein